MAFKSVGLLVFFLAVAFLVLSPNNVFAQTGGTGIVVGTVTDPSGAAVPGATVTLTDTATNAARTAITNEAGRYNFSNVLPGNYNLTISKALPTLGGTLGSSGIILNNACCAGGLITTIA